MRVVAVHQPNFFPWLGYFDKICRADRFVLLDDVQFKKTGGAWTNRVKLSIKGNAHWLTAPVERNFSGVRKINEMVFCRVTNWRKKMNRSLQLAYSRAPFFDEVYRVVEPLIMNTECNVAEYNIHIIKTLVDRLGFSKHVFVRSSDFGVSTTATERLIELVKCVEGDIYLSGDGADGYLDDEAFVRFDIGLQRQNFQHPTYPQLHHREFFSGLSILDSLMNIGFTGVRQLLISKNVTSR